MGSGVFNRKVGCGSSCLDVDSFFLLLHISGIGGGYDETTLKFEARY